MKTIHHKDRPAIEFPDERWRPTLRLAINRSAGSETLSVWFADMEHHQRTPLHWHDTEEVLMFSKWMATVLRASATRSSRSRASVVVPPRTVHAFGMRNGNMLKSVSILPDADAVPGHRVIEKGETFEMPEVKKK